MAAERCLRYELEGYGAKLASCICITWPQPIIMQVHSGGGVACCPRSDTYVYLTDGGAIYGNEGDCEFWMLSKEPDSGKTYPMHGLYLSKYMLGGGAYSGPIWRGMCSIPMTH